MQTVVTAAELAAARDVARRACAEQAELRAGDERCDDLLLVLSELVGNACRHGRPPVAFDVTVDGEDLLVTVEDHDPDPPPGPALLSGPDAENGRGLFLVAALSRLWGWEITPAGKVVWARV